MIEAALILMIAGLLVWAAVHTWQRSRKGSACCGEHEQTQRKVCAADRNKSHYPWEILLEIGGMTCAQCARKVENALNSQDATWAKVDFSDHRACVRTKAEPDERKLRDAVAQAGYVVTGYSVKKH